MANKHSLAMTLAWAKQNNIRKFEYLTASGHTTSAHRRQPNPYRRNKTWWHPSKK